jgi:aerobic carbon-monoxide dehydrogenase medium subunit
MYPAHFDYERPATVEEAIAILARHRGGAKLLAGGHSLIPAMKLRLAQPRILVDIGRLETLSYVRESVGGTIAIGAMTTHAEIAGSRLLRDRSPLVAETAAQIGDMQVRNKGTIGGSLAHADPAADYPAAILALDAEIELAGPRGRRTVAAGAFFVDLLQTAIAPDELLVEVRVPTTGKAVAYEKSAQKASGFAIAGVAAVVRSDGVRVGITGVAATAYRAAAVEATLAGRPRPARDAIALAAARAADGVVPLEDIHATRDYRAHLARVNARRAIERAVAK